MTIRMMKGIIRVVSLFVLAWVVGELVSLPAGGERAGLHTVVTLPPSVAQIASIDRRGVGEYVDPITRGEPADDAVSDEAVVSAGDNPGELFQLVSVFLVKSAGEMRGFAAIAYGREERLYSVGEILPQEYFLVKVETTFVVLEKNGKLWSLGISGKAEAFLGRAVVAEEEYPLAMPAAVFTVRSLAVDEPESFVDSSGMPGERFQMPAKAVDEVLKNLHRLLHDVRVETDISRMNGGMRGIRIHPREGSLPALFGLRSGDVVRSVNGRPLQSIDDLMTVYQEYLKKPPARLKVLIERDGSIIVKEFVTP